MGSRCNASPRRQRPAASIRKSAAVVLFHSPGCHLCENARDVLVAELGEGEFGEVDITGDDELEARYREWLPVVEIGGERAFVYFVDPAALRRKVAQTRR